MARAFLDRWIATAVPLGILALWTGPDLGVLAGVSFQVCIAISLGLALSGWLSREGLLRVSHLSLWALLPLLSAGRFPWNPDPNRSFDFPGLAGNVLLMAGALVAAILPQTPPPPPTFRP